MFKILILLLVEISVNYVPELFIFLIQGRRKPTKMLKLALTILMRQNGVESHIHYLPENSAFPGDELSLRAFGRL